jgi:hypothetical protein
MQKSQAISHLHFTAKCAILSLWFWSRRSGSKVFRNARFGNNEHEYAAYIVSITVSSNNIIAQECTYNGLPCGFKSNAY